jgi:hypothetical protein
MTIKGREELRQAQGFPTPATQSQLAASGIRTPQHTLVLDLFIIIIFFTAVNLNLRSQAVSALDPTHPSSLLTFLLAIDARGRLCES